MITIGQLAGYAGVTIKAVRHYHQRGLLPEPERDASGYRRYTADHAIALVKIKTLADAGVPLARVKQLLAADPAEFAAAIADIDADLRRRAAELRRTRARIAQLDAGDRLFVAPEVADFLDRLRALGVSPRGVRAERDGWILVRSFSPDQAAALLADKVAALDDPEFRALYLELDAAYDWAADDPRLPALAERSRRWLAGRDTPPAPDPTVAALTAGAAGATSPAWDRLHRLTAPAGSERRHVGVDHGPELSGLRRRRCR